MGTPRPGSGRRPPGDAVEKAGLESAGGGNCVAERAGASVGQLEEGTFMAGRPHGQVLKIREALNSLLKSFRVLL